MPSGFSVQPVTFSASAALIQRPLRVVTLCSAVGVRITVMRASVAYFGTEIVTSLEVMNSNSTGTPFFVCSMPRLMAGTMSSVLVMRSP